MGNERRPILRQMVVWDVKHPGSQYNTEDE